MVGFGRVERFGPSNLRHDWSLENITLRELAFRCLGELALCGVVREDRGSVLFPAVGELAAVVGRVDLSPKYLEQILIGNLGGVVLHLHRFQVPRSTCAHVFVRGRTLLAARVA